jgi:deoxyribonuclease (pyrimidine dimer)
MTRINCVPPEELTRQHLVAEYRELPRVFGLAHRACLSGREIWAPALYSLGSGHVRFFYRRLGWCLRRFQALRAEMIRRGYAPKFEAPPSVDLPADWWEDWEPDAAALAVNRERIQERLSGK